MVEKRKLMKSFGFAFNGITHAIKNDQNFKIHLFFTVLVVAGSIFFDVNPFEMGILGIMILIVITTEMINTAIEHMVDLITSEYREDAKIAKDVSAGMVLIASVGALIVGFLIFTPYLLTFFNLR